MLVADNGVETAVSSFGNVRISDLTIVNSQPGGARTTGLNRAHGGTGPSFMMWRSTSPARRRTWPLVKRSELARDPGFRDHRGGTGRDRHSRHSDQAEPNAIMTLERSLRFGGERHSTRPSNQHAAHTAAGRLSHFRKHRFRSGKHSLLEIVRTEIVGQRDRPVTIAARRHYGLEHKGDVDVGEPIRWRRDRSPIRT